MAQYVSYKSSLARTGVSENMPQKSNVAHVAGAKRTALTTINGNKQESVSSWKCDQSSIANSLLKPEEETRKFSIFEDTDPQSTVAVPKASSISKFVTQLITYDKKPTNCEAASKENAFTWVSDVPKKLSEREKEYLYWSSPHISDIYAHLRTTEKSFRPRLDYMTKQRDITHNMRSVLVDWLVEVGEEYKLLPETLHLAVAYTDRFLSFMSVLRGKLQLVGTACMFISSKYEEIYPPELKDFVYITDDTYTKKQVLRMEHMILKVLDFNVATPTAYTFLQLFCCMSNASDKVSFLAQYICEISLLEAEPFLAFLPSQIAAGALALAKYTLGEPMWSDEMVELTSYMAEDISSAVASLYDRHSNISSYPQQSIPEKYKSSKFHSVAEISPLEELFI